MAKRARLTRARRRGRETLAVSVSLFDDEDRTVPTDFAGLTFAVEADDHATLASAADGVLTVTASTTQTGEWTTPRHEIRVYVENADGSGERVEWLILEVPCK